MIMGGDQIKRREFLKLGGKAALLSAVLGGSEILLSHNNYEPFKPPAKNLTGKRNISNDSTYPTLVSVKSTDYKKALAESIALSGGISRFISKGDIVTIKPNIGWDRTPEQGANTNPILVAAMAELCLNAGAKKVVVTDVSCNDPRRCFQRAGIIESLKGTGAEVILPQEQDFVQADLKGEILSVWPVLRPFLECDKLINMPIVKHHGLSRVTIGMKNWFGVLGGARNRLHQKIDISIADLSEYFRPTLVVVDATHVLVRNGPVGGNLADVAIHDTVFVSTDQVAADSFGCSFLDVAPGEIGFIKAAYERGLGKIEGYSIIQKDLA
jgi:uncharacterized protein (DUF362 family)